MRIPGSPAYYFSRAENGGIAAMENLNLVLKFKTAGRDDVHVKGAARITVDGRGGLLFYDALSGRAERIDVENVQLFYIPQMSAGQGPSLHSHLVC